MRISMSVTGFRFADLFDELTRLNGNLGEAALAGAEEIAKVTETSMKASYGKTGDYIADSIGYNVEMGRDGKSAVASVGVFHVDRVMAQHLRFNVVTGEDGMGQARPGLTAPQIAWWLEYGTVRTSPRPFLETGYLLSINQQEEAFRRVFGGFIDRAGRI